MRFNKMRLIFILLLLFNYNLCWTQDYFKVDSIALSKVSLKFKSVDTLVHSLIAELTTEEDKYRVIFTYLSEKMTYDRGAKSTNILKNKPYGNCAGISNQYKELCLLAGLKCEIVHGKCILPNKSEIENHACNMIYINDKKYFVDVTFSLKKEPKNKSDLMYPRNEFFFKAEPKLYFITFRPNKRKDRLVKLSFSKFKHLAKTYGSFFYVADKFVSFPQKFKIKKNKLEFVLNDEINPDDIKIITKNDQNIHPIKSENNKTLIFDLTNVEKGTIINVSMKFDFGNTYILQYVKD